MAKIKTYPEVSSLDKDDYLLVETDDGTKKVRAENINASNASMVEIIENPFEIYENPLITNSKETDIRGYLFHITEDGSDDLLYITMNFKNDNKLSISKDNDITIDPNSINSKILEFMPKGDGNKNVSLSNCILSYNSSYSNGVVEDNIPNAYIVYSTRDNINRLHINIIQTSAAPVYGIKIVLIFAKYVR